MKKLFENPESYANEYLAERGSFILIKVESKSPTKAQQCLVEQWLLSSFGFQNAYDNLKGASVLVLTLKEKAIMFMT